jgi:hypothetical protein
VVPDLYVFEEEGINAFAAGTTPDTAVVAVSRGALSRLNREELQGVVAHEFSHIFNGDMRLNLRLIGLLHGILVIAMIGYSILRGSGRGRGRGAGGLAVFGLALLVIGYVGVFFSRLIKSAVSRQREFLADASAVQFTRNPDGILGALMKIRRGGSALRHARTEELSHLFFAKGLSAWSLRAFATHPPLEDRINAIRPGAIETWKETPEATWSTESTDGVARFAPEETPAAVRPSDVVKSVGNPSPLDLARAGAFRTTLPEPTAALLATAGGARRLVYALLESEDETIRKRQRATLASDPEAGDETGLQTARAAVKNIRARLPLVELAVPALRELPEADRRAFLARAHALVAEDNRVHPFEFAAEIILEKSLVPGGKPAAGARSLDDAAAEAMCLLSFLAYAGAEAAPAKAEAAFRAGFAVLSPGRTKAILPWDQCGHAGAAESLRRLAGAAPEIKRKLLEACAACVLSDRRVRIEEWEIVRAFAEALECPVPLSLPLTEETAAPA